MSTDTDTTTDNGESETKAPANYTDPSVIADAHRELTQLSAYVVKSVLETMAGNPMMAASLGPEFVVEATQISERLTELLVIVNPGYGEDSTG